MFKSRINRFIKYLNICLIAISILLAIKIGLSGVRLKRTIPETSRGNKQLKLTAYSPPEDYKMPTILRINDFETMNDFYNMLYIEGGLKISREGIWKTSNNYSIKLEFYGNYYCEVALTHFPPWWHQYDSIKFDTFLEKGELSAITLRIGDSFSPDGFCANCQKFVKVLNLPYKNHSFSFSIQDISDSIDIDSPFKSIHLGFTPSYPGVLYLDNFRLVSND